MDIAGGLDYSRLKRAYDADDYASIAFTATQDYYLVGLLAYLADPTVFDITKGWAPFVHNQPTPPAFLIGVLGPVWPTPALANQVVAFEAKSLLFLSTQDVYVRFEGAARVQHLIPANLPIVFHRRCFKFYVQRVTNNGTLNVWMLG